MRLGCGRSPTASAKTARRRVATKRRASRTAAARWLGLRKARVCCFRIGHFPAATMWRTAKRVAFPSPLWRPAKLITVRFGSAPSSRDRVDDHGVRVGPWAVPIARRAIRGCCGDRRSGRVGRSPDIRGRVSRGRSPDIRRPSSSACNRGSSNRSSCCRAAVFAPIHSPANASNAGCRKGPSDPGFSRVQRECHVSR
jgi:hypothetical protein